MCAGRKTSRRTAATITAASTKSDMQSAAKSNAGYNTGPKNLKEKSGNTPATRNCAFTSSRTMNPQKMREWLKPNFSLITAPLAKGIDQHAAEAGPQMIEAVLPAAQTHHREEPIEFLNKEGHGQCKEHCKDTDFRTVQRHSPSTLVNGARVPPCSGGVARSSAGTISSASPTIPRCATSKMGAVASLLMAMIWSEFCMPTRCWMAPEMPQAMYSRGFTVLPVWPTCRPWGIQPAATAPRERPRLRPARAPGLPRDENSPARAFLGRR